MKLNISLVLLCAVASGSLTITQVTAKPLPKVARTHRTSDLSYHEVALRISNRVLALKGKVVGFRSISRSKHVHLKEYPFKPIVDYRHRILKYEPVPDSEPPMKRAIYAEDGFTLAVWMVRGDLTWKPTERPVEIGPYKIAVDIGGPQRNRIKLVVDAIVAEAARYFNSMAQSNKRLQLTAR